MELYATIDYSPNPCAENMKVILDEEDLKQASDSQMERFLRVWVKHRAEFAPKLLRLEICLRQGEEENDEGILRFLHHVPAHMGWTDTHIYREE